LNEKPHIGLINFPKIEYIRQTTANWFNPQARGFAPIGMVECWNIGKPGLGILHYWVIGPPKVER
jgi:hypothetical protein